MLVIVLVRSTMYLIRFLFSFLSWHCHAFIAFIILLKFAAHNEIEIKIEIEAEMCLSHEARKDEQKTKAMHISHLTHTDLGYPRFQFGLRLAMEVDIDISYLFLLNEKCSKYEIKKKQSVSFFFMWGPSFSPALLPARLLDGLWDGVAAAAIGVGVEVRVRESDIGHRRAYRRLGPALELYLSAVNIF